MEESVPPEDEKDEQQEPPQLILLGSEDAEACTGDGCN